MSSSSSCVLCDRVVQVIERFERRGDFMIYRSVTVKEERTAKVTGAKARLSMALGMVPRV